TFNLPDLRGRFLRGVSDGSDVDPDAGERENPNGGNTGDAVGTYQGDEFGEHSHEYWDIWLSESGASRIVSSYGSGDSDHDNGQYQIKRTSDPTGDSETRPKNAAVNYIIKY
ncbi:MAG: tail fiber protein, partial [bacterium]|nr:tail fiber protein [bacterium]